MNQDSLVQGYLPDYKQKKLRSDGVIQSNEVAIKLGDLLLAEDTLTGARRIVKTNFSLNEDRELLKG